MRDYRRLQGDIRVSLRKGVKKKGALFKVYFGIALPKRI